MSPFALGYLITALTETSAVIYLDPDSAPWQSLGEPKAAREQQSDHMIFRQHAELVARQPQFVAEDFDIVLADQRGPFRNPPRRAVVNRRFARVDKAAAELWVFHLFPETAVMQMWVIEQRLRGTHRSPGKAAFLGGVINLLCRQASDKVGDQSIDDVRRVRRNDRRVLIFWIPEVSRMPLMSSRSASSPTYFGLSRPPTSAQT